VPFWLPEAELMTEPAFTLVFFLVMREPKPLMGPGLPPLLPMLTFFFRVASMEVKAWFLARVCFFLFFW